MVDDIMDEQIGVVDVYRSQETWLQKQTGLGKEETNKSPRPTEFTEQAGLIDEDKALGESLPKKVVIDESGDHISLSVDIIGGDKVGSKEEKDDKIPAPPQEDKESTSSKYTS